MSLESNQKDVIIRVKGAGEVTANSSQSLHSALAAAGIELEATCGGRGTCGKCKIKVLSGQVADRHGKPAETDGEGNYLACQVYPQEDLVLDQIAKQGVSAKGEIGGILINKDELNSVVKKLLIEPEYPTLKNNFSLQEMIRRSGRGLNPVDIYTLKELALTAARNPEKLTLTVVNDEITNVQSGDTTASLFGAAFDIGSTTVAGMLLDINQGEVIAAAAETNPQTVYGSDVISRITAAATAEGLKKLSAVIRECLNRLLAELCATAGITNNDVYLVTVAGNSTMEHLLMGISPTYLTLSPYVPVFNYIPPFLPNNLQLDINPGGRVLLLPNIASFVGADTVAAITAVDQDLSDKMTLLIDLGTNGELALGNKDRIAVCSTAAGPAFEGAQLSCGMRAAEGAIDNVTVTDDVYITTIKHEKPRGICGSGIIKAIAELVRAGVITDSGRFAGGSRLTGLPDKISERMREKDGAKVFILAFAHESATGEEIYISQLDIREIQLVKSSICTGAEILMENIGVKPEEIEQVLIAGAFGNYIDLDSAVAIGLIPQSDLKKIHPVGNAAGAGAVKALLSEGHLARCYAIAGKAEFVELANHPAFQEKFVENLAF